MKKNKEIKKLVIDEFSSKNTQIFYIKKAESGLWKSEEKLIDKYFAKNSSILDIGCGTGRTTIALSKKGYSIIGIDITPKMIENAKKIAEEKKMNINYLIGDAVELDFLNESFDNALFSNQGWAQIPGSENRIKSLKEVYKVLKPGGIFIFTFHQRKLIGKYLFFWIWQWIRLYILKPLKFKVDELDFGDRFFKRESSGVDFKDKQYIHIASKKEVINQVGNAGFKIIYSGSGLSEHSGSKPIFIVCQK